MLTSGLTWNAISCILDEIEVRTLHCPKTPLLGQRLRDVTKEHKGISLTRGEQPSQLDLKYRDGL